ncbi:hypothetical protein [Cupriavidus necator]
MTLSLSTAVIADRLQALTRAIDGGSGPGVLNIYDGTRPATGEAVTTQNKLVAYPFADPSAGSISGTTLTLLISGAAQLALKTGIASWARIVDSAGTFVADMDVGVGKEVVPLVEGVPNSQLYEGGEVSVSVATLVEA